MQVIKNKRLCVAPVRTHVQPQQYGSVLCKMYGVGLLAWRPDTMLITQISHQADVHCMTIFPIRKYPKHESLMSWPRHANALAPNPPKLHFPKPRHFI